MSGVIVIFFNDNKLSSHIAHIGEHINSSNHKIHSNDKMRKMIVNLFINKGKNNNKSSPQLTRVQNSLPMSIVKNPERYLSNVEVKYDMRKARIYSVNS